MKYLGVPQRLNTLINQQLVCSSVSKNDTTKTKKCEYNKLVSSKHNAFFFYEKVRRCHHHALQLSACVSRCFSNLLLLFQEYCLYVICIPSIFNFILSVAVLSSSTSDSSFSEMHKKVIVREILLKA